MKRSLAMFLLATAVAFGSMARAADAPPALGNMMKERIDIAAAESKIRDEQNTALAAQSAKASSYWQTLNALQGPAKSDADIAQMKAQVESMKVNLAAQEQALEMAQIKDPADRAAKLKELTAARDKAQQELFAAQAPYSKRIMDLDAPMNKDSAAYADALKPFILDGSGLKADKPQVNGMWVNVIWKDADGKIAVVCGVNVEPLPEHPFPYPNKIDDKYPIEMNMNNAMNTRVGYFHISMNIQKTDLQGDSAKVTALLKSLLNLDGLAAAKPQ